jgi:hypothetical protein
MPFDMLAELRPSVAVVGHPLTASNRLSDHKNGFRWRTQSLNSFVLIFVWRLCAAFGMMIARLN